MIGSDHPRTRLTVLRMQTCMAVKEFSLSESHSRDVCVHGSRRWHRDNQSDAMMSFMLLHSHVESCFLLIVCVTSLSCYSFSLLVRPSSFSSVSSNNIQESWNRLRLSLPCSLVVLLILLCDTQCRFLSVVVSTRVLFVVFLGEAAVSPKVLVVKPFCIGNHWVWLNHFSGDSFLLQCTSIIHTNGIVYLSHWVVVEWV